MSKSYVIWGCLGHAKVLSSIITSQGGKVLAFFDNREVPSILPDTPIFTGERGFYEWLSKTSNPSEITGLVAIGGHNGDARIKIHNLFHSAGMNLDTLVHPQAFVCHTAFLGKGSQILGQAVVAADARLGITSILNHKASVDHECVVGNGAHLAPGATLCGCVTLGDNVMIGANAVVLPRITVGANTLIGAGAVVTKDVPPSSIIVGNPGRPLI